MVLMQEEISDLQTALWVGLDELFLRWLVTRLIVSMLVVVPMGMFARMLVVYRFC